MPIEIRHEQPGEEELIETVVCEAFDEVDEANIIRMMRQHYPAFDPRYSITAWERGRMVGHALFSPARVRLMGRTVLALAVGPVAVAPDRQRKGIGGQLMRFGHAQGIRDGYALAFLYGHRSYYPRFGYRSCFGMASVTLDLEKLPRSKRKFHRSPVRPADIPWLVGRQNYEWGDVDFGWLWGTSPSEWTLPYLSATMWHTEKGQRAAYTIGPLGRDKSALVIAEDPELAREVLAILRPQSLRHHPAGWLVKNALDPTWSTATATASPAAMACELREGVLQDYLAAIDKGERLPGYTVYPLPFLGA